MNRAGDSFLTNGVSTRSGPMASRRFRAVLLFASAFVALAIGAMLGLLPAPVWVSAIILIVAAGAAWLAGLSLVGRKPAELLFLVFVASLPFTRLAILNLEFGMQPNYLLVVGVLALLVWRSMMLRLPLYIPRSPITVVFFLFIVIVGSSCLMSGQTPMQEFRGEVRWIRSFKQMAMLLFMFATYITTLLIIQSRRMLRRSIQMFLAISILVSLYGLYQFIAFPLGLPFVDISGYNVSFGETPFYAIALAGGRFLRVWSTFSEPVWFGDYLVAIISLLAAYVFAGQQPLPVGRRWHTVFLGCMLMALLVTFARSAWFAMIAAFGVLGLIFFRPRAILRWAAVAGGLLLLLGVADFLIARLPISQGASFLSALTSRFLSPFQDENFGNIHRHTGLVAALEMFKAHPWIGVGYGNFGFHFYLYKPLWGRAISDWFDVFPVMSGGMFFRLLSETGVIGTGAFVLLILAILSEAVFALRRLRSDPFLFATIAGLLSAFVGLIVRLTMADSIHFTYTWVIVGLIAILARRIERFRHADTSVEEMA